MNDLIPLYRKMAKEGTNFQGLSVLQHADSIRALARAVDAQTMIDYGCGRGDAYRSPNKLHQKLGIKRADVRLYDPAFREHDAVPSGQSDLVVCSDVLEHIPESHVDVFLMQLFGHARKAVWASVCCRPAKKFFPDTEINLHVTIQPFAWWEERFVAAAGAAKIENFKLIETP